MTETTLTPTPSDALSALNVGSVGRQVTPSVMQRLPSPFWNSWRITALMQEFAARFQTDVSQPLDIFSLCIALSRSIDYAIAHNEALPADHVRVLASQLKKICQKYSDDRGMRAGIMVLMLSAKNACSSGWFSDIDTKELLSLVNKIGDSYCSLEDINAGPSCLHSSIPTIMARFYPLMKMGQILASLEVKPGYNAYMIDFHIAKNIAYSPQEKIRLFVAQVDNLETSACIISPPRVNFILNGREVDRRNIISMDTGPQMPTNVTAMLKFGPNLLQAVGQFNGHYIIVIAFMSVTSSPDASVLHDYVQPPVADSDADNDISEGPSRISLNCPISYTRIRTPVKGRLCKHFQCFDLSNFLDINSRRPSWRCPHCNQSVCYLDIRIDKDMVKVLKEVGQDVSVIIISAGGSWKAVMEIDDHLDQAHDLVLNSTKERSEQEESTCPPNASPNILDLTEDETEVDVFRTSGVEDRKPSHRVNQNDTAQAEDEFRPRVFVTSGSGAYTAGSDTHVFGSTSQSTPANFLRVPPVLTEAISPTINLQGGGQSNTNPTTSENQTQLSLNSDLLLQQLQYASSNEYGRFPTIPRMPTRTPIAVQALPAQSLAPGQHQRLRTSSNSSTPSSSSFPCSLSANANGLNTVTSDLERQRHFSRSHLNPHQASAVASSSSQHCSVTQNGDRQDRSFIGNQSVQQVVGLQARSQLPSAYKSPLGLSEFQNAHLQQALNPRIPHLQQTINPRIPQPMGQTPNVNRPSSYLPRNPAQQGNSQVRTPHISVTGNSQQNRTIATHRASQMARQQLPSSVPIQSQSLRSGGAPFPLNAEGVRGPSMVGGRTNAVSTSRTDTPMELPSEQNWEPRRMRGSLRGQELNDYYREIMGEPLSTPQPSQPARPQSNLTSAPPILPTQEQVLMANSRVVHSSQQTHTNNS
ncbi:hypothetical protein FNV43_RR09340 [Rhamnella rubrinervis]|uniref:SP-RING-type domain-containing protein n=1 Tax=Rhamnella rubrinervis TaxID=2594499 RepID=A0A8K0MJW5_9ROSA|nr:hypothetical protein FNV43_RR09340 [Rhamnella rubrinervis]